MAKHGSVRKIGFVLLICLVVYGIYMLKLVHEVKGFRTRPQLSFAREYFSGNMPHKILIRALIFKAGVSAYENTIRNWAYFKYNELFSNTLWNRWILEKDIKRMTSKERLKYLPRYPLTISSGILPYFEKTLSDSAGYEVLTALSKSEAAKAIYQKWIEDEIVASQNSDLFRESIRYIVMLPDIPLGKLFDMYYLELVDAGESDEIEWRTPEYLQTGTNTSLSLLKWLTKAISSNDIEFNNFVPELIGTYYSSPNAEEREIVHNLLMKEIGEVSSSEITSVISRVPVEQIIPLSKELFGATKSLNPQVAIACFDQMCHHDLLESESFAKSILAESDSELRKGIVVILVRHSSSLGEAHIDEAFSGLAPRRTFFTSISQYIYGSKAADEYRLISRHDYLETGKTWPPSYVDGPPYPDESDRWRKFIDKYPWFPGTDDAYYRLGYAQFHSGDYLGAANTIREYTKREFADEDAKPYLKHLLVNLAFRDDPKLRKSLPELKYLRVIPQPGVLMTKKNPDMKMLSGFITWLDNNPGYQKFLDLDPKSLKLVKELVQVLETLPPRERYSTAMEIFIRNFKSAQTYWPDWADQRTFLKALYGILPESNHPYKFDSTGQIDTFVKETANQLHDSILNISAKDEKRNLILWALFHYYYMPEGFDDYHYYNYSYYFRYALEFAAQLDKQDFPPNLQWMYARLKKMESSHSGGY